MTTIEKTYFTLLRAAVWQTPLPASFEAQTPWQNILHLAIRQGTGSLIAERLLTLSAQQQITLPAALLMQCKALCGQNMMQRQRLMAVFKQAWTALQEADIQPVLLKGFGLAEYYHDPELRQCGDIDIFVGKDAYHPGAETLRRTFPKALHFDEEADYFKHYNLVLGDISIEMHRVSAMFAHPKDSAHYERLETEAMAQAQPKQWWRVPEWKFNVLFVFFHSWEHWLTETACIRQLTDLAVLIAHNPSGKNELEAYLRTNLKHLHLTRAWQLYAYIMVHYLGLPEQQCPLYTNACAEKAEQLLAQILQGKDRSQKPKNNAPKNVLLRKLYTLGIRLGEACDIARIEPQYARHTIATTFRQSWERFKRGENTRRWE